MWLIGNSRVRENFAKHESATMRPENFGTKPSNTKIQITKGGDFFEIYIPPYGFDRSILLLSCLTIFWNGFILIWTYYGARELFPTTIYFILFSIPFWFAGMILAYLSLFYLFGKTYLRIDRHETSLIQCIFGKVIGRQGPVLNREIQEIIFTRQYFYLDAEDTRCEYPAELKIEIGAQPMKIGGRNGGIEHIEHEAEIEWLASEVSEWLDKPLIIIEAPA
jgi:hypothetical protein